MLKIPNRPGIWLLLAALAVPLPAETFVVTKTGDDDGACTDDDCALREAVLAANATPGPDVIELSAGNYHLSIQGKFENMAMIGDLDILDDLEIHGVAPTMTRVVGYEDRIFHIGAKVLLANMTITGGSTGDFGGGVRITGGDVTIIGCDISGNTTVSDGGALFLSDGKLTVIDSTIRGNTAGEFGGGIRKSGVSVLQPGDITLINTTISENTARGGGAIASWFVGDLVIKNSTIADNIGTDFAGGIFFFNNTPAQLDNVLIVRNGCAFSNARPPISNGGNIESPANTCFTPIPGDQVDVPDAGITPLGFYGGSTATHALLPASPAIDAAVDADCQLTDQRGRPRTADGNDDGTAACDVGAYERQPNDTVVDVPALGRGALALLALLLGAAGVGSTRRRLRA